MSSSHSSGVVIEREGFKLRIDAMDSLGLGAGTPFEPETLAALQQWVRPGMTVVDVGANIGYFTLHLSRLVGEQGSVHAFEPEPVNFSILTENIAANVLTNVALHHAAVGRERGEASLHISDFNGGMHRLYESVCCVGPAVRVPVLRIDDVLANSTVDLIKIDIEGFEEAALRGAENCLRQNADIKIITEYCPASMLEAGGKPSEFLAYLHGLGLRPSQLDGTPIDLAELLADAHRYEQVAFSRFLSDCNGKSNPEILDAVVALAAKLGCKRPMIENLLFSRPKT